MCDSDPETRMNSRLTYPLWGLTDTSNWKILILTSTASPLSPWVPCSKKWHATHSPKPGMYMFPKLYSLHNLPQYYFLICLHPKCLSYVSISFHLLHHPSSTSKLIFLLCSHTIPWQSPTFVKRSEGSRLWAVKST